LYRQQKVLSCILKVISIGYLSQIAVNPLCSHGAGSSPETFHRLQGSKS
jgi:hypothetical protein